MGFGQQPRDAYEGRQDIHTNVFEVCSDFLYIEFSHGLCLVDCRNVKQDDSFHLGVNQQVTAD